MKIVVVDFEMCGVGRMQQGKYPYTQEIIQIGAVCLDEDYKIEDSFCSYVKPEFGYVSAFIRDLTGISAGRLRDAPGTEDALTAFADWLPDGEVTVVAWSDNDERQLKLETEIKGIRDERIERLFDGWKDCQPMFAKRMGNKRAYRLEEALIASDIITDGRAHDGLVDARNTALLYAKMMTEEDYKLNPYYELAHNKEKEDFGASIGDLFAGLDFGMLQAACA